MNIPTFTLKFNICGHSQHVTGQNIQTCPYHGIEQASASNQQMVPRIDFVTKFFLSLSSHCTILLLGIFSFKTSADRLSAIFRDLNKHQTPLERAVYWIEHVLRFGGAHLRPRSVDMGTIELYMLDVMLFLIIVIFVIAVITKRTVGCLYRCCCKKNNLDASRRSAESKKEK